MKKVSDGAGHEANAAQVSDGTQENLIIAPGICRLCSKHHAPGDALSDGKPYACGLMAEAIVSGQTVGSCAYFAFVKKLAPLQNTYDRLEFSLKEKGYWTPADERRPAKDARIEIPAILDADTMQAQAEARIRGCGA